MDPHHRKIDLQSPADLQYLRDNIRAAAQQKLDLHIPPSAAPKDGEDIYRRKVEEQVEKFIQGTLSLALPSLTINGFDASPTILAPPQPVDPSTIDPDDPNYEPYDPRLAIKLRELYAELEAETTRSAELRREAPSAAAQSYVEKLRGEMASQDKQWDAARRSILEDAEGGLERWELPRSPEVRATFEKTQKEMESLKGVTEAVARLERAKRAALEVEGS